MKKIALFVLAAAVAACAPAGTKTESAVQSKATVYFTSDISPEGLVKIYDKISQNVKGKVAIKFHTGEPHGPNILPVPMVKALQEHIPGSTLVETNVLYPSPRQTTEGHRETLKTNGWTFSEVDIMDEDGAVMIPVKGGKHFKEISVGKNMLNYDSMVVLTHFKGHAMGGFGGAIKNISIGVGSSEGKNWIHTAGTSRTSFMGGNQDRFLESMAEAAGAVIDYMGEENMVYISVMNHLSVDCDCDGNPAEPDMHDIGILASLDPVALDQACVDLVYAAPDGASLIQRMESRNGIHTLDHAEDIGVGSQTYQMVSVD